MLFHGTAVKEAARITDDISSFPEVTIKVPNKTEDFTFAFVVSNGTVFDIVKKSPENVTDYVTADQTCKAKGGFLAVIDSSVKQQIIQDLIKQHVVNFTQLKATYIFGKFFFLKLQWRKGYSMITS